VLTSDAARFSNVPSAGPNFLTIDEESSGIIEVTDIVKSAWWFEHGRRYFLADLQDHHLIPGEEVEGGQLYLVASPKRPTRYDRGDHSHHSHDKDGYCNDDGDRRGGRNDHDWDDHDRR
jgi:hypothetical protein